MKKILSVLLSCILMLSMTTTASMAYTSSEISTVSDEQLLKKIVDKDTDVVYSGDKKIEKLPLENDYVEIDGITEYDQDELENINLYMIKSVDGQNSENEEVTVITDMEVETPDDVSEISPMSSGGTKNKTQKCGRVTAYMKCWYTNKSFNKSNGVKLTKTGGKITQKENDGLVIRKLKSTYTGKGTCWNSSGKTLNTATYTSSKAHSAGAYSSLQSWDTSSIDRYYYTGGTGLLQARFYVTYGGTTAASQAQYSVSINLASLK